MIRTIKKQKQLVDFEDEIAFILSDDFCAKIVKSKSIENVCEGDCVACRTHFIAKLVRVAVKDLKTLAVPCDNNIRYKIDKVTFDEVIDYFGEDK